MSRFQSNLNSLNQGPTLSRRDEHQLFLMLSATSSANQSPKSLRLKNVQRRLSLTIEPGRDVLPTQLVINHDSLSRVRGAFIPNRLRTCLLGPLSYGSFGDAELLGYSCWAFLFVEAEGFCALFVGVFAGCSHILGPPSRSCYSEFCFYWALGLKNIGYMRPLCK